MDLTASASATVDHDDSQSPLHREIVHKYYERPTPPSGVPAVIPRHEVVPCAVCHHLAGVDGPPSVVICDVCERGFHASCAKISGGKYASRIEEFLCGQCYAVRLEITVRLNESRNAGGEGLKDLRRYTRRSSCKPYYDHLSVIAGFHYQGVYPRLLVPMSLNMADSPAVDVLVVIRTRFREVLLLLNHNVGDNSSGAPVECSNLHNGSIECATVGGNIQKATDAEITRKEGGHSSPEKSSAISNEEEEPDVKDASENSLGGDGSIPEWAKELEPARKLKTNVGSRIRSCVYNALQKNPPTWAKKILEHSISKEVYRWRIATGATNKRLKKEGWLLSQVEDCNRSHRQRTQKRRLQFPSIIGSKELEKFRLRRKTSLQLHAILGLKGIKRSFSKKLSNQRKSLLKLGSN
ncbi:hypothetical protein RIF29_19691 [Crotalaria pallida]|uniref:Zinc finger PHD-type domain-containing protein n=1 Tax=Crotalaria pallida TaxID=3830 RepID=A0AAN9F0C5_CROPI